MKIHKGDQVLIISGKERGKKTFGQLTSGDTQSALEVNHIYSPAAAISRRASISLKANSKQSSGSAARCPLGNCHQIN